MNNYPYPPLPTVGRAPWPCDHMEDAVCNLCYKSPRRAAVQAGQYRTSAALPTTAREWYVAFFADDDGQDILELFD